MAKTNFFGALLSICLGFIILALGIYFFAFYLLLLAIASIIFMSIVINDIFRKTSIWKITIKFLCFGYIAALTNYFSYNLLESQNRKKGDTVIAALYKYKQTTGKFPKTMNELPETIKSIHGNYITDSSYQNFKFHYRDLYGFPKTFISKDSSWKLFFH